MKKAVILFILLFIIVSVFFGLLMVKLSKQKEKIIPPAAITPVVTRAYQPTQQEQPKSLYVISTEPKDEENNMAVNQKITVTFNREFLPEEIIFSITPEIPYDTKTQNNQLIITPKSAFSPGEYYTFVIKYPILGALPRTYSFTVTGPTKPYLPDTFPEGAAKEEDAFQSQSHPDVFLTNKTPYSTKDFSISSDYKSDPVGHFYFIVILKGTDADQAKSKFTDWLKSLNLTDGQIQNLDIIYKE